ncbi:MAG: hypothetical protein MUF87_07740 [Anaerolineae bacterium]|jgi:hypothetical protein|nr:hypothetical protein [Anaerolineae bacterium]
MNTSAEALKQLEAALTNAKQAAKTIEDLITAHDYQDVAHLTASAAVRLLEATAAFMRSSDEEALGAMESADDYLDEVYGIIEGDLDDE